MEIQSRELVVEMKRKDVEEIGSLGTFPGQ